MKTHLSFNGYCVKAQWKSKEYKGRFISYGRLVNPNGNYVDAPYVAVYFIDGEGYGYIED